MTAKNPAIDDVPSLSNLSTLPNGDELPRVKCPCGGGLPGSCPRCGGCGVLAGVARCLGCGGVHSGSGQAEMKCLRKALIEARAARELADEEAAHRGYVTFGTIMAQHRSTEQNPVKFVDAWVGKGPKAPPVPEIVRTAWRSVAAVMRGR